MTGQTVRQEHDLATNHDHFGMQIGQRLGRRLAPILNGHQIRHAPLSDLTLAQIQPQGPRGICSHERIELFGGQVSFLSGDAHFVDEISFGGHGGVRSQRGCEIRAEHGGR